MSENEVFSFDGNTTLRPLILFIGGSISYTAEISIATMEGDEEEDEEEEEEEEGDEMEELVYTRGKR